MPDVIPITVLETGSPAGPRRRGVLLFLLSILLCAVPLGVRLGQPDTSEVMEQFALVSSQETWLRQHRGETNAWVVPSLFGLPRTNKPPLTVWLNLLAWRGLPPDAAPEALVLRARIVSAALALTMLAGVFWMTRTLWDPRAAALATLVAGSMWFFQKQARVASYDIQMAAWVTLAAAAMIWAQRPLRVPPGGSIYFLGWVLAGVFLAAAVMTKGPLALAVFGTAAAALVAVDPGKWRRLIPGLMIALFVAAALALPWYAHVWISIPDASRNWLTEYKMDVTPRPVYYYLGLLGLVLPWTLWLIGGFFQPFRAEGDLKRRLLVPWVWFFLILILFSIPSARRFRYILPIVPAAAILIAQVFREHQALADQGVVERDASRLWVPHWIGMALASPAFGLLILFQGRLVQRGWLPELTLAYSMPAVVAVISTLVLAGMAAWGWWAHRRWKPMLAGFATAGWALVLTGVFWFGYAGAPHARSDLRAVGEGLRQVVGGVPVRTLAPPNRLFLMDRAVLFYSRLVVPPVKPEGVAEFVRSVPEVVVIAEALPASDGLLRGVGMTEEGAFKDGKNTLHRIWRSRRLR